MNHEPRRKRRLLLKKREKLLPAQPYGGSLIGVFTFTGDIGLKWKYNAFLSLI